MAEEETAAVLGLVTVESQPGGWRFPFGHTGKRATWYGTWRLERRASAQPPSWLTPTCKAALMDLVSCADFFALQAMGGCLSQCVWLCHGFCLKIQSSIAFLSWGLGYWLTGNTCSQTTASASHLNSAASERPRWALPKELLTSGVLLSVGKPSLVDVFHFPTDL